MLRGHNWVHIVHRLYSALLFKLRYLKNLKLFSIRVKELFEPIAVRRKYKATEIGEIFSLETSNWAKKSVHKVTFCLEIPFITVPNSAVVSSQARWAAHPFPNKS